MKKILALSFLWAGLALIACTPSVGGGESTGGGTDTAISIPSLPALDSADPIIGTWKLAEGTDSIIFRDDGTFTSTFSTGSSITTSYSVKNDLLMQITTPPVYPDPCGLGF